VCANPLDPGSREVRCRLIFPYPSRQLAQCHATCQRTRTEPMAVSVGMPPTLVGESRHDRRWARVLLARSASTGVSQNYSAPRCQRMSRCFSGKEATAMRTRLCIQLVIHCSCIPERIAGPPPLPGTQACRIISPRKSRELRAQRLSGAVGKMPQQVSGEFPPIELTIDVCGGMVQGSRHWP
jgi:hypothetical protein